ncbi:class I SAM-dependent methyltransferase [Streptomyces sp. NPDC058316]|uniref:class I SAM-dependent methyltransferase n=1 Tax=unclassified Streptomyces TaxID=2593676 RepID=UPI003328708B
MSSYVLDPAWHVELSRLENLCALYDPGSTAICEQPGLGPGRRSLNMSAGTGSVARMFAEWVGSQGEVLAVDADTRFLEQLADDTITVLSSDVTVEPPPQGRLDLVHARLLLEHLPASEAVLRAMRARPGRAARSWWRTWTGPPRSP